MFADDSEISSLSDEEIEEAEKMKEEMLAELSASSQRLQVCWNIYIFSY